MDIPSKPTLQTILNGLGPIAGGVLGLQFGAPCEGVVVGGLAGLLINAGLVEGFKKLPGSMLEHLPEVRWNKGLPILLTQEVARVFRKMDEDFELSPGRGENALLIATEDLVSKTKVFGRRIGGFGDDLDHFRKTYRVSLDASLGQPDQGMLNALRRLDRRLTVCCSVIEPSIVATLFHMRDYLQVPLDIDFKWANGVEQMEKVNSRLVLGEPYDVLATANAPFLSADSSIWRPTVRTQYAFILPIHRESQHMLRPKLKDASRFGGLKGVEVIRFLADSSCQEQFLSQRSLFGRTIDRDWSLSDLPELKSGLDANEAVIVYDPLARHLLKSGLYSRINSFDYELWISLFACREIVRKLSIERPLAEVFTAAWTYCKLNRAYAREILQRDGSVIGAFNRALLITPLI